MRMGDREEDPGVRLSGALPSAQGHTPGVLARALAAGLSGQRVKAHRVGI